MQRPEFYCLIAIGAIVRSAVVALAALLLAAMPGAARAETPVGCATPPTNELVAYRCKFYDGEIADVVARAREWIKWRAPYAHNPALVLDIDETSLSNWKVLYQNQFVFVPAGPCNFRKGMTCGELAWERMAVAPAIGPTRDLFGLAKAEHVTVFSSPAAARARSSAPRPRSTCIAPAMADGGTSIFAPSNLTRTGRWRPTRPGCAAKSKRRAIRSSPMSAINGATRKRLRRARLQAAESVLHDSLEHNRSDCALGFRWSMIFRKTGLHFSGSSYRDAVIAI